MFPDIFNKQIADQFIDRINQLRPDTQPQWGKMASAEMLAHCNVAYEMALENKHKPAVGLKKWFLKTFLKPLILSPKPYKHNLKTSPEFIISDAKDFEFEKNRLISYLNKVVELGKSSFEGKESLSFGRLSSEQWNTLFSKHLIHHLNQFGI